VGDPLKRLLGPALLTAGCAAPPEPPAARWTPEGLELQSAAPIASVALTDPAGRPHSRRRLPAPLRALTLPLPAEPAGAWTAAVQTTHGEHRMVFTVPVDPPALSLRLQAPAGQPDREVSDQSVLQVALLDGAPVPVALQLRPHRDGPLELRRDGAPLLSTLGRAGEPQRVEWLLQDDDQIDVLSGDQALRFWVKAAPLPLAEAQADLRVVSQRFPARADGRADPGREPDRLRLPSAWWGAALRALGQGPRAHDPWHPSSYWSVTVENTGQHDMNVLVTGRVLRADGAPSPLFAPRLRGGEAEGGAVSALVKVPAGGQAPVTLPVYVHEGRVQEAGLEAAAFTRELELRPLGSPRALLIDRQPIALRRGSVGGSLGLLAAIVAGLLGAIHGLRSLPTWLRMPTSTLMTISLFAALSFLVSAGARLLAAALASLLGPMSVLISGLIDDVLRVSLLATLLMLHPRRGVAALHSLVGWLLGGVALGDFAPTDVLFVGGRIFWMELGLALSGLSGGEAWTRQARPARWLRLSLGLGAAQLAGSATGVALHMTLYRLFMADWYIALVLIGPGFLYVSLAAALSLRFSEGLRELQR